MLEDVDADNDVVLLAPKVEML
jgi:hypothetical protein